MNARFLGHGGFEFAFGNLTVLVDPFMTPTGNVATISLESLAHQVLVLTHGHFDHVHDAEALSKLHKSTIIANWEVASYFEAKECQVEKFNAGGTYHKDGLSIRFYNAVHGSSLPDGSYGGLAQSFVATYEGKSFYFSGDTDYFSEMEHIGKKHKIDTAFLCIGGQLTMDIPTSIDAAKVLNTSKVVGMHFNTFPIIAIDPEQSQAVYKVAGIDLILPELGQSIAL
jgi:L-ascorbate metabolism protein UlaG (beta-lactamase superfamily)